MSRQKQTATKKREVSPPLAAPARWRFRHRASGRRCRVVAQSWFEARARAARLLGVADLGLLEVTENPVTGQKAAR